MLVSVHPILEGTVAKAGGFRINFEDHAEVYLARDLTVEQQAEYIAELVGPEDRLEFTAVIPTQRTSPIEQVQVAG